MGAFPSSERTLDFPDPVGSALPTLAAHGAAEYFLAGRCVLAVVDATPEGKQAAWRGALVARDCGMPLHLVHAGQAAKGLSSAQPDADRLALQVQHRLGVACSAEAAGPDLEQVLTRLSPRTGLLVLPYRRGRVLAECLLGTAAERIFRSTSVPTIVVKRPATTSYRRVLVPVELDDHAALLIDAARCISRDPRIRVLHVLSGGQEQSLRIADAHEHAVRAHREHRCRDAYVHINRAMARAGASDRAAASVSFGDAWSRVLEVARASRAQLVVLGKRQFSLVEQLLTVSVSTRLIRAGNADVLLLPLRDRAAGGPSSATEAFRARSGPCRRVGGR